MKKSFLRRTAAICLTLIMMLPTSALSVFAADEVSDPAAESAADTSQDLVVDPSVDGADLFANAVNSEKPEDMPGITTEGDEPDPDVDADWYDLEQPETMPGETAEAEKDSGQQDSGSPDNDETAHAAENAAVSKSQLRMNMQLFNSDLLDESAAYDEEELLSEDAADEPAVDPLEETPVSGTCGENVSWTLSEGQLSISGSGAIDNYSQSPWTDYSSDIFSVVIEEGVTAIGQYAFSGLTSLESAQLPDSIEKIGYRAFYNCTALTLVNIPLGWNDCPSSASNGTKDITYCGHIFEGCSSLTSVDVPEGMTELPSFAFNYCDYLTTVNLPSSLTSIRNHVFAYCSRLTKVAIPDGVTLIEKGLFLYCSNLTDVTIPDGVTELVMYSFYNCKSLESVHLPDSIEKIGGQTFYNCTALKDINIPLSWNECPSDANSGAIDMKYCGHIFEGCSSLTSITVPEGMTELPSYAFNYCDYLTTVTLPSTLTNIRNHAFANCSRLTEATIPEGVTVIQKSLFLYCPKLAQVSIPDGVTEIAGFAFEGCRALKEVHLPDSIEKIGYQSFYNCSGLKTINIPRSWNDCPSNAKDGTYNTDYCGHIFEGCTSLTSITVPEGMTELPSFAFNYCNYLTTVTLPSTLTSIKNHVFANCSRLTQAAIPEGVTFIQKGLFLYCSKLTDVTVPDGVTELALYSFYGCKALKEIHLPDSIEKIGCQTFYNCTSLTDINIPLSWNECPTSSNSGTVNSQYCGHIFEGCTLLSDISIPDGMTALPDYAFCGSNYITTVNLPDSLKEIGKDAFYECASLVYTELPDSLTTLGEYAFGKCISLRAVVFPASLKTITANAYNGCTALSAVSIPKTVTKIEDDAFASCDAVDAVYYEGNEDDWNALLAGEATMLRKLASVFKSGQSPAKPAAGNKSPFPSDVINFNILCDYAEPDTIKESSYTKPEGSTYDDFYGGSTTDNGSTHYSIDLNDVTFGPNNKNKFVSLPKDSYITYGFNKAILCPDNSLIVIRTTGIVDERGDIYVETAGGDQIFVDTVYETSTNHSVKIKGISEPITGIKVVGRDLDGASPGFDIASIALLGTRTDKEAFGRTNTAVSLKRGKQSYNLLTNSQTFEEFSDEEATILVSADWQMEMPGTIALVQDNEVKAQNKGGSFVDIQPGKLFTPSKRVYVVLLNKDNEVVDRIRIWLKISKKVVNHTVTYNGNGGSVSFSTKTLAVGDIYGDFPAVKKSGYFCKGWYTAKTGGTRVYEHQEMSRDEDHTLYARWVKADLTKASYTMAKSVKYNGKAQKPKLTVKLGGVTLKEGVDYTATYSNNKLVSANTKTKKAKVVIKGKGVFAKSKGKTLTFVIKKGTQVITIKDTDLRFTSDKKGSTVNLGVSLKFGSTMTITAANISKDSKKKIIKAVTIPKASAAKAKLNKYGTAKITIKSPGTKNYSGATKTMYVSLQRSQDITLTSSKLVYDKVKDWYVLEKTSATPFDLGIKSKTKHTAHINCRDGADAALTGDNLAVPIGGTIELTVSAADTREYTGMEKTFVIKAGRLANLYEKAGDWTVTQDSDGKLTIDEYSGPGGDVTVPAILDVPGFGGKKPVKAIGDSVFKDRKDITSVKIEGESFTTIGANAFRGCTGMTKLELPESLIEIGGNAFYGCSALNDMWLPQKIKTIGTRAFYGCKALPEMDIPTSVTSLGGEAFAKCSRITVAVMPGKIKTVAAGAFNGCSSLKEITIPATVTSFGEKAFNGCSKLKTVWYGSGKSQWKSLNKGSGNETVNSVHVYTYADGPAPSSAMTDEALFGSYKRSLDDKSFFHATNMIQYAMQNYMCGFTHFFGDDYYVALKHSLSNAGPGNIADLIKWAAQYQGVEERKIYQELALEVMKEALNSPDYKEMFNNSDVSDIYDMFKTFYKKGDNSLGIMLKDDEERYRFAQRLAPYFEVSASEMNKVLKVFQSEWDAFSVALGKVGKGISATEYICTFFTVRYTEQEALDRLIMVAPKGSHLYTALMDTKALREEGGFSNLALTYIADDVISDVAGEIVKFGLNAADDYWGGHKTLDADCYMFIASTIYKTMGRAMDAPSYSDYYRAFLMMAATLEMRNEIMVKPYEDNVYPTEVRDGVNLYIACLKAWEPYVTKTIEGFGYGPFSEEYLSNMIKRYEPVLTAENYMNTCKYHAVNGN